MERVGPVARAWVFVDCFKASAPWAARSGSGQPWLGAPLDVTPDGWVASLQPGQVAETAMLDRQGTHYPTGQYVCLYDGIGTLQFLGDGLAVSQSPGRIVVQVTPTPAGRVGLRLVATDPADPVRNIRFMMPGFEGTTETFHPEFVGSLAPFRVIRFLNWMRSNNSPLVSWGDRTSTADATQDSVMGVAPEYIADLCNEVGADAWICIPHQADDEYVTNLAALLRDRLDPNLRVYLEYSNEIWGNFGQSAWAAEQGLSLGLSSDPALAALRFQSVRSVEIFRIFEDTFGGRSRLVRVLAALHSDPATGLEVITWDDAWQEADALATAPYFGGPLGNAQMAPQTVLLQVPGLLSAMDSQSVACHAFTALNAGNAATYGLRYLGYEGGQALYGQGGWENDNTLTNLFVTTNRDPGMRGLYLAHLQRWQAAGGELFMAFVHTGAYGSGGSWGLLEGQSQDPATAPKWLGLMDWLASLP